jgi:acyl carrier protein
MDIEKTVKEIIGKLKEVNASELAFTKDTNFIEELHLDSFEVVNFVNRLEQTFNIDFGTESTDFDSLKSWATFLANIEKKITKE